MRSNFDEVSGYLSEKTERMKTMRRAPVDTMEECDVKEKNNPQVCAEYAS